MEKNDNTNNIALRFLYNKDILSKDGIREVEIKSNTQFHFSSNANMVLGVIEGDIKCDVEDRFDNIKKNCLVFFGLGMDCTVEAINDSRLIFLWTGYSPQQEDYTARFYTKGLLANDANIDFLTSVNSDLPVLPFNKCMKSFFKTTHLCVTFKNQYYYSLKIKEFFFLLGKTYSKNDRHRFFESSYSVEQSFSIFVYKNYRNITSIQEFANLASCSLSSFEKRFRRIFGQSASTWIAKQKAQVIYSEICDTSKPFKQLSYEHGFSYPAHFTRFCKLHLGESPSMLRKMCRIRDKND